MDTFHTAMTALLAFWGVITAALVCMLIYRSTLASHEDDHIILDSAGNMAAQEQRALLSRIDKLSRPITLLLVSSGTLLVVIAGLWLWQGFRNF